MKFLMNFSSCRIY